MEQTKHSAVLRSQYQPSDYLLTTLDLLFRLFDSYTEVVATSCIQRNPQRGNDCVPLQLQGEDLELLAISYNGLSLATDAYSLNDKGLSLLPTDSAFTLQITTRIYPDRNTALEGLYRSSGNYCTQCEAEGFRRITYALDRPDILARYTTRIEAEKASCPVLLANGNLIESGDLNQDRHYAVWQDPFPKPSYLFALVAGNLRHIEDWFTTRSGRRICLRIYVEERNISKCGHAMRSLQQAMRWDEETYGREYDLDIFMIVAVDDFNMGAMENKGLNIFNSKYILALPETATDDDYLGIEGVVAHEYFHNWTGNRITCRDWFQLSLKEGLTVFRDQQFSADMNSPAVQRIDDVRLLRTAQFREDAGPMAHPIRPDSYVEINNFYTSTVYNKGAEVIRMMHTLLGASRFRLGMDLYFSRHDGQAVTCDDFVAAMAEANAYDLDQFKRWYSQSGTPVLEVQEEYDPNLEQYCLTVRQSCPPTPGQAHKEPYHLPIVIGLLDGQGTAITIANQEEQLLELRQAEERFVFEELPTKPVLSFLRNFSAPVIVKPFQSRADQILLMANDPDLFNRWEVAMNLAEELILAGVTAIQAGRHPEVDDDYVGAVARNLADPAIDKALLALTLQLPSEIYLAGKMTVVDPDRLFSARQHLRRELASRLQDQFLGLYTANCDDGPYELSPAAMGRRSLKNTALSYLMLLEPLPQEVIAICLRQYETGANMTDIIAALANITNTELDVRQEILDDFYANWQSDPLVLDKWFSLQAASTLPNALAEVEALLGHPAFSIRNPNKVRALIGAFAAMNHVRFHAADGKGYTFLADRIIELNGLNPQIAARLVSPFTTWKKYDGERQMLIRDQLERLVSLPDLSRDVYEIVKKSL